ESATAPDVRHQGATLVIVEHIAGGVEEDHCPIAFEARGREHLGVRSGIHAHLSPERRDSRFNRFMTVFGCLGEYQHPGHARTLPNAAAAPASSGLEVLTERTCT